MSTSFEYMVNGLAFQGHQSFETLVVLLVVAVAIAFAVNIVTTAIFGKILGSIFGNIVMFFGLFIIGKIASIEAAKMFNRAFYMLNYTLTTLRY